MARPVVPPSAVVAYALKDASNWWEQINESPAWQDRIFHVLAALYGIVAAVALVPLSLSWLCYPVLEYVTLFWTGILWIQVDGIFYWLRLVD